MALAPSNRSPLWADRTTEDDAPPTVIRPWNNMPTRRPASRRQSQCPECKAPVYWTMTGRRAAKYANMKHGATIVPAFELVCPAGHAQWPSWGPLGEPSFLNAWGDIEPANPLLREQWLLRQPTPEPEGMQQWDDVACQYLSRAGAV